MHIFGRLMCSAQNIVRVKIDLHQKNMMILSTLNLNGLENKNELIKKNGHLVLLERSDRAYNKDMPFNLVDPMIGPMIF